MSSPWRTIERVQQRDVGLCVLGALLALAVAVTDLLLDGSLAIGLGYSGAVLLGLAARQPMATLVIATVATLAGLAAGIGNLSRAASDGLNVDRFAVIILVWVFAVLVVWAKRSKEIRETRSSGLADNDIFQAVFNQTFQFVAVLDPKGNIIEANQTLKDFAGLTAEEIRAMPIWMLPIFQNESEIQDRLREVVAHAGEGNFSRDEFVISGIGEWPTVIDLSLKPIRGESSAIEQLILEARDITEARTQQEMLTQAQKMEAVGELTAGIAHDFNNLLTVIAGNLELLEQRVAADPAVGKRLKRAIEAVFKGQALTQQLLAFSRRQSLSPSVIDVNVLIQGMSALYEALGDSIHVELDLAEDLLPSEIDPTLLESALLNIAINARHAMPDGGTLRIGTQKTVLEEDYHGGMADLPAGDYLCITVTDDGEGIPEDILPNVFDPFFTTKSESSVSGSGLGLSMVYGFVKQSGGDVKIYSEIGQGTTVRLYLPVTDKPLPEAAEREKDNGREGLANGKSVLLAEDDEAAMDVILEGLKELGCAVEVSTSGDAAIDLIRAGKAYDLVFTDMVMAGDAQGLDVAHAARAALPGVPVIFCSGFPRQSLEGEEPSVDGALFLAKPFHQDELVSVVERALERGQYAAVSQ